MRKIGLLSDTHGYWDDKYLKYFADCDEIWHAGDIGSDELAARLTSIHPFQVEQVRVMMTHIGGYPGRYNPEIRKELFDTRPQLFIAGHSHILKVAFDPTLSCLYMNPGAAGKSGFHLKRTLLRFVIDGDKIKDLEVIELGNR